MAQPRGWSDTGVRFIELFSHKKIISTLNNTEEITNDQYNEFLNEITTVADAGASKFILDKPYFISEIERLEQLADSINNGW